jgi:hypothetical protein
MATTKMELGRSAKVLLKTGGHARSLLDRATYEKTTMQHLGAKGAPKVAPIRATKCAQRADAQSSVRPCLRPTRQGSEDLAQIAIRGLFPGPLPPRQVADFSVGKLVGFLAAPHHAEITISSASHCAMQLVALHVARTT